MPTFIRSTLALLATAAIGAIVLAGQKPVAAEPAATTGLAVATFAAGCFWCVESDFDHVDGVVETISGYTGGKTKNPTYYEVGAGGTGHAEALQVKYDPAKVSYTQLLDYYWHHVDFVDGGGQFCDRGDQYRPAIFTHDAEQMKLAEESKAALAKKFNAKVAVEIVAAATFTPAEDYHQDYYKKNPLKYRVYRNGCGRDARVAALWGKESAGH